jgi:hypothetical protein
MIDEIVRDDIIREVHVGRAAREGHDPAAPVSADRVARLIDRMAVTP